MIYRVSRLITLFCFYFLSFLTATAAHAAYTLNMPYGVSPISHDIYNLHMATFYICCVIAAVVFIITIYSLIKFRKSKGVQASSFHEHLALEITWTTIPFLILIGLAIPATIVLAHIHNTEESALTIKVTGYQWKWQYEYLDSNIKFFSYLSTPQNQIQNKAPKNEWFLLEVDKPMVVPVDTKVKLLITSDDVIHAWWVPELGVKQDAIPGFINENWIYVNKPGIYRGQCGELCGINHGFMPIVVQAVSQEDFAKWVMAQNNATRAAEQNSLKTFTENQLLTAGKDEYEKNCAMCHQNNGAGLVGSFPALKNSMVVTSPMGETIAYILHGVPGTPMQAFAKILDDQALAEIITYIRHAWGNGAINEQRQYATTAQPRDVYAIRKRLNL